MAWAAGSAIIKPNSRILIPNHDNNIPWLPCSCTHEGRAMNMCSNIALLMLPKNAAGPVFLHNAVDYMLKVTTPLRNSQLAVPQCAKQFLLHCFLAHLDALHQRPT